MARVEHQDVGVLPQGSSGIHGAQLERAGDVPRRAARRSASPDKVGRPSLNRKERKPLCLVMGLPFSSYMAEPSSSRSSSSATATAEASMHSMDSHWFRPIESPTNTRRRFRSVSSSLAASKVGSSHRRGRHLHMAYSPSGRPFSTHRNPSSTNGHFPGSYSARRRRCSSPASSRTHSPSTDMVRSRSSSSLQYLLVTSPSTPPATGTAAALVAAVVALTSAVTSRAVSLAAPRPEEAAARRSDREERSTQAPHSAICWSLAAAPAA
nr:unnamed protein product [Digitaria exilis]